MSLKPVLRHSTPGASKNVKFRMSRNSTKFDVVAKFREVIPTVKSVFIIRDLEKFRVFTEMTIFAIFQKIGIFSGLTK